MIILKLSIAALIGMLGSLIEKNLAMGVKAKDNTVIYPGLGWFIRKDYRAILLSLGAIVLLFLLVGDAIYSSKFLDPNAIFVLPVVNWEVHRHFIWDAILVIAFSTVGYSGLSVFIRLWGQANRLLNFAIKLKTPEPEDGPLTEIPDSLPKTPKPE